MATLHQVLDVIVPSSTTVMELIEWSAAKVDVPAEGVSIERRARVLQALVSDKCSGCGEFISAIRVEMGLTKCSDCDGKPRRKGRR